MLGILYYPVQALIEMIF